ncbi:phosphotransferase [Lentzea sp. JNUCC 0626]|uniref:phosphotransferase n=1 Tax=Lentzea sp. JNUCC 0626 TaxID=3367513 RepID=UPI003749F4F4
MSESPETNPVAADLARVRLIAEDLRNQLNAEGKSDSRWEKYFQALDRADTQVAETGLLRQTYLLANSASNLANWFQQYLDAAVVIEMLKLAIRWYEVTNNGQFDASITQCRQLLARLEGATRGHDAGVAPQITQTAVQLALAGELSPGWSLPADWEDAAAEWRRGGDGKTLADLVDAFAEFADEVVFRLLPQAREWLVSELGKHLDSIVADLREFVVPLDGNAVHYRARTARKLAFSLNLTSDDVNTYRMRWLVAGLWNFALMRESEWQSNRPQIVVDLLGYTQSFQIYYRYRDDRREHLLWMTRLLLRSALDPDVVPRPLFDKTGSLVSWIRHSTGTYLLLSGPSPTQPSLSAYDPRVGSERDQWADELLQEWEGDGERDVRVSVALSLLSLSDWSLSRLEHLLQILFSRSKDTIARIELWLTTAKQLIDATRTIRIGVSPWSPGRGVDGATISYKQDTGAVVLPDITLRAVASELSTRSSQLLAQGAIFEGRRVPTFLCFDNFGPVGILKIDRTDRVDREKKNFDSYAKRLHPRYRPSECVIGTSSISDSAGDRFRAVLTSYVFSEEDDDPTTLTDWLVKADAEQIGLLIDRLFLQSLRPWLSHVERLVGDLRDEYPLLRPSINNAPHAPERNTAVELQQFTSSQTAELFGQALDHTRKDFGSFLTMSFVEEIADGDMTRVPEVNPLWLAAEVGECHDDLQEDVRVAELVHELSSHDYLTCISHGDLHGDNVLIAGNARQQPNISLIDFETTHEGHICKDFARLESALITRTIEWTPSEAGELVDWFVQSMKGELLTGESPDSVGSGELARILGAVARLRKTLAGCGQGHWPINTREYQWAILASLLPFARYSDTAPRNRVLAFVLAGHVATALYGS